MYQFPLELPGLSARGIKSKKEEGKGELVIDIFFTISTIHREKYEEFFKITIPPPKKSRKGNIFGKENFVVHSAHLLSTD